MLKIMEIYYAHQTIPKSGLVNGLLPKSIFLAGPSSRGGDVASWRIEEAIGLFKNHGFDGSLFMPESKSGDWVNDYLGQIRWEQEQLNISELVLFWFPQKYILDLRPLALIRACTNLFTRRHPIIPAFLKRGLLANTTQVEFGQILTECRHNPHKKIVFGRPDYAYARKFMDSMIKDDPISKHNNRFGPFDNLPDTIKSAIKAINNRDNGLGAFL